MYLGKYLKFVSTIVLVGRDYFSSLSARIVLPNHERYAEKWRYKTCRADVPNPHKYKKKVNTKAVKPSDRPSIPKYGDAQFNLI